MGKWEGGGRREGEGGCIFILLLCIHNKVYKYSKYITIIMYAQVRLSNQSVCLCVHVSVRHQLLGQLQQMNSLAPRSSTTPVFPVCKNKASNQNWRCRRPGTKLANQSTQSNENTMLVLDRRQKRSSSSQKLTFRQRILNFNKYLKCSKTA